MIGRRIALSSFHVTFLWQLLCDGSHDGNLQGRLQDDKAMCTKSMRLEATRKWLLVILPLPVVCPNLQCSTVTTQSEVTINERLKSHEHSVTMLDYL